MAILLHIETATPVCSIALGIDGNCVSYKELVKENSHSSLVTVMIDELLKEQGLTTAQLNAVAISYGPGSYTGLRIGTSVAKGMCYALDIPLIAISTLKSMAWGMRQTYGGDQNTLYCPMIDARRMEVYASIVNAGLVSVLDDSAVILDEHSFEALLQNKTIVFAGDGSIKAKTVITNDNAFFIETQASSCWMCELAANAYREQAFADTAYFTPFYLKEFQTTVPRKKV
jgi:tRNA threonylcarbamoyladenosine biosynthesis protein TsaB